MIKNREIGDNTNYLGEPSVPRSPCLGVLRGSELERHDVGIEAEAREHAGFEGCRRGLEPKNIGSLWKQKRNGNGFCPRAFRGM